MRFSLAWRRRPSQSNLPGRRLKLESLEDRRLLAITADAGGPYTIAEGDSLVLAGSAAGSANPISYAWDLNGDNNFSDATGANPTLTWSQLEALGISSGPASLTAALQVTDTVDLSTASASSGITLNNVAPSAGISGPSSALRGEAQSFTLTASDPSSADQTAGFTFAIDWGDGSAVQSVTGPSGTAVQHAFAASGALVVSVTAADQNSAVSVPATQNIATTSYAVRNSGGLFDLVWNGTPGGDSVKFTQLDATTIRISTTLENGVAVSTTQDVSGVTGRVIASGLGGNDTLDASALSMTHATLDGGAGNNTLLGGAAGDTLIGGSTGAEGAQGSNVIIAGNGANTIYGNAVTGSEGSTGGNNLIVGGTNSDTIYGNFGTVSHNGGEGGQNLIVGGAGADSIYASQLHDGAEGGHGSIMVGGQTTLGTSALQAALAEWTSADSYADRVAKLEGKLAGGVNGSTYLQRGATVTNDAGADQLFGDTLGKQNWFLSGATADTNNRVKAGETQSNTEAGLAIWKSTVDGFWDVASNWQNGYVPQNGDDVVIGAGAGVVTFRSGAVALNSLVNNRALAMTGGVLTIATSTQLSGALNFSAGQLTVNGDLQTDGALTLFGGVLEVNGTLHYNAALSINKGTLRNATIIGGPSSQFAILSQHVLSDYIQQIPSATLDDVTIGSDITIADRYNISAPSPVLGTLFYHAPARVKILNGLTLNAQMTLGNFQEGTAVLTFSGAQSLAGNGTIVGARYTEDSYQNEIRGNSFAIDPGITIRGEYLDVTANVNYGSVIAEGPMGMAVTFQNEGTIQANSGTTIKLDLAANSSGQFTADHASIYVQGFWDGDLDVDPAFGTWTLDGGTVRNGTVTQHPNSILNFSSNQSTFDNVVLVGDLDLSRLLVAKLSVVNAFSLSGNILIGSSDGSHSGVLTFGANNLASSFPENTTVIFGGSSYNSVINASQGVGAAGTLTIPFNTAVQGGGGSIQNTYASGTILLKSVLSADHSGQKLTAGGTGSFINQGTIVAWNGSTIAFPNAWAGPGSVTINQSTFEIGGSFTQADLVAAFTNNGGTVRLTGTLTGDLNLNSSTGSWQLYGGTIKNSTITQSGGSRLVFTTNGGTFDNVTLPGDLDLTLDNGATLSIANTLSVGGGIRIGNTAGTTSATLQFVAGTGSPTMPVGANIVFGGSTSNALVNATGTLLLLPATTVISGSSGTIKSDKPPARIRNQGTISANVAGGTITLADSNQELLNEGIISADNGGNLKFSNGMPESGTITNNQSLITVNGYLPGPDLSSRIVNNNGSVLIIGSVVGNLNVTGGAWQLVGGSISNGTITESAGGRLAYSSTGGSLSGVTLAGNLDLSQDAGATVTIKNAFALGGSILIGDAAGTRSATVTFGAGTVTAALPAGANVVFGASTSNTLVNGGGQNTTAGKFTIPATATIHGASIKIANSDTLGSIINLGVISSDLPGGSVRFGSLGKLTNQGTISVLPSNSLTLDSTWTDSGVITASSATVNLRGSFSQASLGGTALASSTVNVLGTLTGNLALDSSTGSWTLNGGTLSGGTLTTSNGTKLFLGGNPNLTTYALSGDVDTSTLIDGGIITVRGGLALNTELRLGDDAGTRSAKLQFGKTSTAGGNLSGTGTIVFGGNLNNEISNRSTVSGASGSVTIAPTITIRGKNGQIFAASSANFITNQGSILADTVGGTIKVGLSNSFVNQGLIKASNGGLVTLKLSSANAGTITAGAGSTVTVNGAFSNGATGTVGVELAGTVFPQYGRVIVTGAATLNGTLNVTYSGGFTPSSGDMFLVMSFSSLVNQFSTINGNGFTYTPTYASTSVKLTTN